MKKNLQLSASLCAIICATASASFAQEDSSAAQEEQSGLDRVLDQVVVTATKRTESAQDIAVAVSAIGEQQLEDFRVDNFSDYLLQIPTVTAGGSGPGQNTIYIRGVASTTPALTIAGVAGLAPNVALYLDEQPVSQPGRNLDIYAVDLARVEVLPGPQGTLFGASSQAGTVRLITNKPVLGEFEASVAASASFTQGGEMSNNVEAVFNFPVTDKLAFRVVGYVDDRGGYIDNVSGTRSVAESARFRQEGTVRPNGVPVSAARAGFQAGADLSGVTFLERDNEAFVEDDFNDTTYAGFRASALYEFNEDWSFSLSHARQSIESDGVFFSDPELGDHDVQRFNPDRIEDDYENTAWSVEGRLAGLDLVYTGAFNDRTTDQQIDYTEYLFVGQYLPYYICDSSVTYPGTAAPTGTCQEPDLRAPSLTEAETFTQELRFNTPADRRLRATVGGFYSKLELKEQVEFTYVGSQLSDIFGSPGFFPNFPLDFSQAGDSFFTDTGPFGTDVIFRNDFLRTDEQFGIFSEFNFDIIPDTLTATFGTRYFDVDVDLEGTANASFCNSFQADAQAFGTDVNDLFDGDGIFTFTGDCSPASRIAFDIANNQTVEEILAELSAVDPSATLAQASQIFNALRAPDEATTDGFIFKGNLSWTPTEDLLFYFTYSEGFRPGLLNRPGGAAGPDGFVVPFAVDTDELTNWEIGWKTTLFDNQLRFNGNVFFLEIDNLQTTIFDPSITNLFFSDNAANAETIGLEGDFTIAPNIVPGLIIGGGFSILDTEITDVLTPTGDVIEGEELAFAPNFQGNLYTRYEWDVTPEYGAHVQAQVGHSGSSRSDIIEINSTNVAGYTTVNLSAGVRKDNWSGEVFAENINNSNGVTTANFLNDVDRLTRLRPRTIGVRFRFDY